MSAIWPMARIRPSLRNFFESIGEVKSAEVVIDRTTNRSKGFGFVEMMAEGGAQEAMESLNGQPLDGRPIKIDFAKPKEDRPRSFSGSSDRPSGGYAPRSNGGYSGGSGGGGGYSSPASNSGGYGGGASGGPSSSSASGGAGSGGNNRNSRDKDKSRERDTDRGGRGRYSDDYDN